MRFLCLVASALILLTLSGGCTKKKTVRTVPMGENAVIGPFIYQVYETAWPMAFGDRVPKDRFLVVRMKVVNSGGGVATVPSLDLVDDSDVTIPELTDGTGVENWIGVSRTVKNGETMEGAVLFDAKPKHYRLRVADESDEFMYVDIPLNMNSEAPAEKSSVPDATDASPTPVRSPKK